MTKLQQRQSLARVSQLVLQRVQYPLRARCHADAVLMWCQQLGRRSADSLHSNYGGQSVEHLADSDGTIAVAVGLGERYQSTGQQ